ncbi:eukaryotic mitochondrial regulator protein-domain-containing protein [Cladorrhinum sp. PSN259]|nr:eukaryotic mitochondrial regulator protein-domain-containing protein [Cladorrhinum sp. PSN259]
MPPRIGSTRCPPKQLLNCLENSIPLWRPATAAWATLSTHHQQSQQCLFSTSTPREATKPQRMFRDWLKGPGKRYQNHEVVGPNYVSKDSRALMEEKGLPIDRPFPSNPEYVSEPVLSDSARETIWEYATVRMMPLRALSAQFAVDIRRIAAVLRMKHIEKRMEAANKPLAIPYAKAVERMLPTVNLMHGEEPFEPINDIHIHSYTMQQLFVPVSESREFTRADAAKAFGDHILPPDSKMRIPELIRLEQQIAKGVSPRIAEQDFIESTAKHEAEFARRLEIKAIQEEQNKIRVRSPRGFEFRFEKINVDSVGRDGRARSGVGWRYGVPHNDRRRGAVKIPTSVE